MALVSPVAGQSEHIRVFLAIADCGELAVAARAHNLSPSIVIRQLAELEAQLGAQLFTLPDRAST